MLSFFPRGVLDEILNLVESVSEEIAVHLAVAFDVYDGVFLCCPLSHEVSWMRS